MDTVLECAKLYKQLLGKEYFFTIEENIKFSIYFSKSNFFHILGLEKLTDIIQFRGKKPSQVYQQILKGKISDKTIKNSGYYSLIEDRVEHFETLPLLLEFDKSNKIIVDFDVNKLSFNTKLEFTKYILYKRERTDYIHFTIGQKNKLYPETFFVEKDSTYISDPKMLDIINIEIVRR